MSPKFKSLSMASSTTSISPRASLPILNTRRRMTHRQQQRSLLSDPESNNLTLSPVFQVTNNINEEKQLGPQIPIAPPSKESSTVPHRASSPATLINNRQNTPECLKGVVACLDIRTEDGDDVSENFENALKSMGAKTRKTFADSVTHLVYKNGSAINVKKALQKDCKIVNLLWITNCKSEGKRLPEDKYLIKQPENLLLAGSKRRKSMEPGRVKALVLDESSLPLQDEHISDKRHNESQDNNTLSKRLKSPNVRPRLSNPHRRKTVSHWETSAIIPREATSSHTGTSNRPDLSLELGDLDLNFVDMDDSSSTSIQLGRMNEDTKDTKENHGRPSLPASFSRSMRRLSFKDEHTTTNTTPTHVSQKPQVNSNIKAGFYIGKPSPTSTTTATLIPSSPPSSSITSNLSSNSPIIRRRRRSLSNRFVPTTLSASTSSSTTYTTDNTDSITPDVSQSSPSSSSPSRLSLSKSSVKQQQPTIVMTSMTEQMKSQCSKIIKRLGKYELSSSVDERTTHVIVGCQRRTESVIFGLLYRVWLVTPDWILDSNKSKEYVDETDYEAILYFPRARAARRHDPLLPSNVSIYIACTGIPVEMIKRFITKAGGHVASRLQDADIIISNKAMESNGIIVTENWLLDSIEHWRYLPANKYSPVSS
ncbi:uncharacterized protein BX664DRAFT_389588 [Halteromyces radiatus]|uniref:uncharacterized protein n=1 Tax=Halteromyces radiatus TaxID=101107 RepID=UPI00221E78D0|nr:uncharacterized protein BX664DRAFT_389588 [Halteromyces radiatus]KAI8076868.1 hypothetical protein BX664DRAFT_389588 [Halteromyces radiatus]